MAFCSACTAADAALSHVSPLLEALLTPTLWYLLVLVMARWGRAGQGRADTVVMNKGRAGQGRAGQGMHQQTPNHPTNRTGAAKCRQTA